ncbi:MFS transporter [Nonomuraea sp. KC401]|uniref:MFS transporter n=1 Tax=unclassified Nonomuraea TaxID=2593643 RepID=UPI0010FE7EB5|nr:MULTISPECIES: MFS transporter [unclassified Nonomuraea]NBE93375.1 MFS transporter [Nonomuraea sp. K271]TLF62667.1 MFS transporter [Nonomuraea sp. KC401]
MGSPAIVVTSAPARSSKSFITLLVMLQLGLWLAILTPATVTLSLRVAQVVPDQKEAALSLVLGVGVLFALVGSPLFGRLSDRTSSRFGRRRPWILAGLAGTFLAMLAIGMAASIPIILVFWCLAQLCVSAAFASSTAMVADKLAPDQRGFTSGLLGLTQLVAVMAGSYVAQLFPPTSLLIFVVPGGLGLLAALVFFVAVPDTERPAPDLPPVRLGEIARSFWVNPRRHPAFAWAFLSRFLIFMGFSTLVAYQVFYLLDHLHQPQAAAANLMFVSSVYLTVASLLSALLGGWLSDRTGRRKPFVFGSAALAAIGLAWVGMAGDVTSFLVAVTVSGFGKGLFYAADLALVSEVLPDPDDSAKDMGVFNVANTLPQSLAPFIAPFVLAIGGGGNYPLLFVIAACFVLLGAAAIYLVKGVR